VTITLLLAVQFDGGGYTPKTLRIIGSASPRLRCPPRTRIQIASDDLKLVVCGDVGETHQAVEDVAWFSEAFVFLDA
jgi:hypothetical protein